jgi:tetrapyrrole methylase family protein/MazG family protein/ATP diphosphatase
MGRPFHIPQAVPLGDQRGATYPEVVALMRRLLAEDGCPWDREQTLVSLRKYVLEEACEVMDALESGDRQSLADELGDLAFQVVFLTELAQREQAFGPDDVFRGLIEKLVRRHPHVFSDTSLRTSDQVESQWEAIKAVEKKNRPLLDNIPRSLPALEGARRMSERAASVGFDWTEKEGSRAKVAEELRELDEAVELGEFKEVEHEIGDMFFALVNYARHLGVDPEEALRKTNTRFRRRFDHVERTVLEAHGDWPREKGKPTSGVPLGEMELAWQEAKELEKRAK